MVSMENRTNPDTCITCLIWEQRRHKHEVLTVLIKKEFLNL